MTISLVPDVRDLRADNADLKARVADLTAERIVLRELLDRYKQRERLYANAVDRFLDTEATSILSIKHSRNVVEVFFDTGAVWRRVTRCNETSSSVEFFEDWIAVKAVPTTRPAIAQEMNDGLLKFPVNAA